MKTFKTNLLGLALAGLILGACSQTGTYETADLMNEQASAAKAGFKMTPFGTGNMNAYVVDQYFSYSSETNTICYDEEGDFTVSFFAQNPEIECGNFQIQYKEVGAADWINLDETNPEEGVVSATLTGLPVGEYTFRAQWIRTGSQASCPSSLGDNTGWQVSTDNLIVEECCTIVGNEFSGDAVSCEMTNREAVYTFGSEDGVSYFKIQGGLNNFTGDDAAVYINDVLVDFTSISDDDWATGTVGGFTIGQRTPGGSSNRNIRVEGGLGTCEAVEVRIVWNSDNSGSTITGSWTVVDALGVELAPEIADLSCE